MVKAVPLSQAIITAVSELVDDSQTEKRLPAHSDIEFAFNTTNLSSFDPLKQGQTVGKKKRVRFVLTQAQQSNQQAGSQLALQLITLVRTYGGFDDKSSNYAGEVAIKGLRAALGHEGFLLTDDGLVIERQIDLESIDAKEVLRQYAIRAKNGYEDAALLVGTSKDLLEATAKYVLQQKWGSFPNSSNLPALLGQAFVALNLATIQHPVQPKEPAQKKVERSIYEFACAINSLRNQQGTGHGRPFLPSVTNEEAKLAIQGIGIISEFLLSKL